MLIFGVNFPLPEIFLVLVVLFFFFLIIILLEIQKLQKMTTEEKKEIEELERLAQEEKRDLAAFMEFEKRENSDLNKFEKDILELEVDEDTIYLKKLAPDLFKIQNYALWGVAKGLTPMQIKQNLMGRGWKNSKMIDMIIEDTLKYTGHIKKGDLGPDMPEPVIEKVIIRETQAPQAQPGQVVVQSGGDSRPVRVEETTRIIKPVKIIRLKETVIRRGKARKPKKAKKIATKPKLKKVKKPTPPKDDFKSIEKELNKMEKDLKTDSNAASTSKVAKKTAKASKKVKAKKAGKPSGKAKDSSVMIEAKKGTEVKVTYK